MHRALAEPLAEKPAEESAVIRHRGCGKPPLTHQVLLVLTLQPAECRLVGHWCRRGDDAICAEVDDKLMRRHGVAPLQLPEAGPVMDELVHKLVVQFTQY